MESGVQFLRLDPCSCCQPGRMCASNKAEGFPSVFELPSPTPTPVIYPKLPTEARGSFPRRGRERCTRIAGPSTPTRKAPPGRSHAASPRSQLPPVPCSMFWRSRSPLERCFSSKCLVMRDDTVPLPEPGAPMITARSSLPDAPMVTDGGPSCADAEQRPGLRAHRLSGPSELAATSGRWPGRPALPEVSAWPPGPPRLLLHRPSRPCTPLPSAPPPRLSCQTPLALCCLVPTCRLRLTAFSPVGNF